MNCKLCQEKILESLAVGTEPLASEVSTHKDSCLACRGYYDTQQNLFRSIDAGLRSFANHPVPPSLVPGVRARLDEKSTPRRSGYFSWSFAAVAALVILTAGIGYTLRRPENHPNSREVFSVASRSASNPVPAALPPAKSSNVAPRPIAKRVSPDAASTTAPEIIVLAEERQAFARFVAEIPREREVAMALTKPAREQADDPLEIALLQIESLEVKPLEGTARE
jgi:hypothetical protein